MSHPHQSMLDEFDVAIKHFVPTVPEEVTKEAEEILADLSKNKEADEIVIRRAFYEVGVKEYPHRRAYQELTHTSAREQMKDMVLEHVDEDVRTVIKPFLDEGVSLDELVRSDVFETQLDAKQRYQVEDGILVAQSKLADTLKADVSEHKDAYTALLKKWTEEAEKLKTVIDELEALAEQGNETQKAEIKQKVQQFREGFLVTEQDPELEEVLKEIEYWTETFAEREE